MILKKFRAQLEQITTLQSAYDEGRYFTRDESRETLSQLRSFSIDDLSFELHEDDAPKKYRYKSTLALYDGQWLGGLRHGEGKMMWPDGASYAGTWHCNQACKNGKFTFSNGDIYEGNWSGNKMCGYGVFRHTDGTVYRGMWL